MRGTAAAIPERQGSVTSELQRRMCFGFWRRSDVRRDRQKQPIILRVNDADNCQVALCARQAIALETTRVDIGPVAFVELKRGVALRACGHL
jgi:hypothetical protein